MGIYISTEAVPDPIVFRKWFGSSRMLNIWPSRFDELKTPVTVDVLEAGLILAFVMTAFCFYIVLPGIRGRERLFCFIRITLSLFLGACVVLCNWGQEWEVDEIETHTQYKAFTTETIEAHVGVKIGLRNVNITLKGDPEYQIGERINYNERFWWSSTAGLWWHQGRIGFGPQSATINQEFRAAQRKGLPYPILWVAEYFTFDGEGIRWGRNYRTAGWYTHIMLWCAFVCWVLANVLYFMNPRYGAYMTMIMGGFLLTGNLLWASIRNFNDLKIPFDNVILYPKFGWCFWLNLIAGLLSVLVGVAVAVLDFCLPEPLATFFGVDVLKDYEEFYPEADEVEVEEKNGANIESTGSAQNGHSKRQSTVAVPQFRKRGPTLRGQKRPVAPPRARFQPTDEGDGMELYENAPSMQKGTVGPENVTFQE